MEGDVLGPPLDGLVEWWFVDADLVECFGVGGFGVFAEEPLPVEVLDHVADEDVGPECRLDGLPVVVVAEEVVLDEDDLEVGVVGELEEFAALLDARLEDDYELALLEDVHADVSLLVEAVQREI